MYHIYMNQTSTTIWIKYTGSSASNRNDMKPNNRERIDILTMGLSAWRMERRKAKTVDGDRQTPDVEGRRRPASSHDGTSQKPDTPPTPCRDVRRHRLQNMLSRHWWHVGDGMGKTAAANVVRKRWISRCKRRRLAPYLYTRCTQQIGKQSITVLWKHYLPFRHLPLLGILNANRKIRKHTDTDVAFTREYSRVSIFHRERECTN